jgi:hypothetical protein
LEGDIVVVGQTSRTEFEGLVVGFHLVDHTG